MTHIQKEKADGTRVRESMRKMREHTMKVFAPPTVSPRSLPFEDPCLSRLSLEKFERKYPQINVFWSKKTFMNGTHLLR
nr:hypothetical protein [Candidatus Njordarchaeota archaeon]